MAPSETPLLRTRALTKVYGGTAVVDHLDLDLAPGRIGLVGANGAGKTTLFRMVLGLTRPTSGSVEVDGIDVASDATRVRRRIGFMPEHDCLPLDQSAADVVSTFGELAGLTPRVARQRASDVLDLVGLDEARFRPVSGFSTGMRQRAKLAQALVADPHLVLLDEPTAGLDPRGREEMLELVHRLGTFGMSVIMATHLLDDVQRVCDHVVMLDAGNLVISGGTTALVQGTGTVIVDVGNGDEALISALVERGLSAAAHDGMVEVHVAESDHLDQIRDTVATLGLPLLRLSRRSTSLDEVFLDRAGHGRA